MSYFVALADDNNPIIIGGEEKSTGKSESQMQQATSQDSKTTQQGSTETVVQSTAMQGGFGSVVLIYVLLFAAIYFFLFRPQIKRQKKIEILQKALKPGDNIITSAGFHGKIVDVKENVLMVEFGTNKSIIMPMEKSYVVSLENSDDATKN